MLKCTFSQGQSCLKLWWEIVAAWTSCPFVFHRKKAQNNQCPYISHPNMLCPCFFQDFPSSRISSHVSDEDYGLCLHSAAADARCYGRNLPGASVPAGHRLWTYSVSQHRHRLHHRLEDHTRKLLMQIVPQNIKEKFPIFRFFLMQDLLPDLWRNWGRWSRPAWTLHVWTSPMELTRYTIASIPQSINLVISSLLMLIINIFIRFLQKSLILLARLYVRTIVDPPLLWHFPCASLNVRSCKLILSAALTVCSVHWVESCWAQARAWV